MTSSCQTAFTPSTKIPLFTLSPCHCNQVRDTGHGLSSLIVKFLIFIFFFFLQAWEPFMISWNNIFFSFFLYFAILLVTNLVTLITCQHLSIFCFDYCQKFFFRIFNSFSQTFQFLHFLAIIFGYSTFWLIPHVPPSTNIVIHRVKSKNSFISDNLV